MDEKRIHQALDAIAREEIKDDMNLWPNLKTQLETVPTPRTRTTLRGLKAVALVAVMLMVSAVTYAVYQEIMGGDPGIIAANNANLVVSFEQTQEITPVSDNVPYTFTVNLEYAYADANRIVVAYQVIGEVRSGDGVTVYSNPTLKDDQGHQFIWLPLGGGGGGGGGGSDPEEIITVGTGLEAHFDAAIIDTVPEELNLSLKVEVAYRTADMPPDGMILAGETVFNFTLPFNPGRVMDTPQTVTTNDIEMTLEKVVVAPSLTRIELCYTGIDGPEADWVPEVILSVNDEEILPLTQLNQANQLGADTGCRSLIIPDALQDHDGTWKLSIVNLSFPGTEDIAEVVEVLKTEYGIEAYVKEDGTLGAETPTDMPFDDYIKLTNDVINSLQQKIEGPWEFTFDLP